MPAVDFLDFSYESPLYQQGYQRVCGVDEVGRGPLAGPVVAAAVILDPAQLPAKVRDSKKMTLRQREVVYEVLYQTAQVGVGEASVAEIDRLNILHASMLAMQRAVSALPVVPDLLLIDGNRCPRPLPCEARAVVKGDSKSLAIAAASVIAKVHRDRIMQALAIEYPHFGWASNAGYGAPVHLAGLAEHGPTPHHRRSFAPVARFFEG